MPENKDKRPNEQPETEATPATAEPNATQPKPEAAEAQEPATAEPEATGIENDAHAADFTNEDERAERETDAMLALEQTKDLLMRTAAEFDNYRKRTEKEKLSSVSIGACSVLEKLLPVLDTLEKAAEAQSTDEEYKKGVCMTLAMFKDALTSLGVSEIAAEGQPFDPMLHAAVAQVQSEQHEAGAVVDVMQKGYMYKDRVLRHSMVTVAS